MFKTLVLSALYSLSDDQIEYQVRDRLSFMRFLGLGLQDRVPDAKTVWLYREGPARAGMVAALFEQFDGYLAQWGYIARGGQILDASIVPVPKNHNTREENKAIKGDQERDGWSDKPAKRSQKDVDARWSEEDQKTVRGTVLPTSKHGENHVNVYRQHNRVRRYHVSDAALPETLHGPRKIAARHAVLRHLLATARRQRCDDPTRSAEFQRDESRAKISVDRGRRDDCSARLFHGCLSPVQVGV